MMMTTWDEDNDDNVDDNVNNNNDDDDEDDDEDDGDVKAYFFDETPQHLFFESSASVLRHWIKERSCRRRCLRLKLTQFWCALVSMLDN